MKGGKVWSTVVDYFLILSAVIGVGFASGKEISVFFFDFGKISLFSLVCFGLLYIYLFYVVSYVKNKLELHTYNQFNAKIFGGLSKLSTLVMLVNFAITCAGMLAGADYLFETFFGIGYKIPSLLLSVLVLLLLRGGVHKIRTVANFIIPVMIATIVINSIGNINPTNVHFEVCNQSGAVAVFYGLLFGINNFVAALPVLFEVKVKAKGKLMAILTICLVVLLNILVLASNNFSTDMPMFELSANISPAFYYIYFATLVMALFSTLMICSYNMQTILCKQKTWFGSSAIVLFNLILSQVGYAFIVQYLYVASGVISAIFVLALIVMIVINLAKFKAGNQPQIHSQNFNFWQLIIDKNLTICKLIKTGLKNFVCEKIALNLSFKNRNKYIKFSQKHNT